MAGIEFKSLIYTVKYILLTKWLANEIQRTLTHCVDRHWNIAVSSDKYNWQHATELLELAL